VGKARRIVAIAAATALGSALMTVPAAEAGSSHGNGQKLVPVVKNLNGPRGVDDGFGGLVFSESDGTVSYAATKGKYAGVKRKIGVVPGAGGFPPAVSVNKWGTIYALTGAGAPNSGAATLYKFVKGKGFKKVADIGAYQAKDTDPYDLEGNPADTNPFGVYALNDGTVLVADAAGNDLLRVFKNGKIVTVARVKPRTVKVPDFLPPTDPEGNPLPPPGTPMPSEAVTTSVTVGSDGYWYVGELRGFPATPGKSQIWRIKPGSVGAVCDPAKPYNSKCKRFADGRTSIVDLERGPHGSIYAVELVKKSWLAMELGLSTTGGLFKVRWGGHATELVKNKLTQPGGVATDKHGKVYVAYPIFGPGQISVVK
jgi:hypothetical protein